MATISVENGLLVLDSKVPVAALDISLTTPLSPEGLGEALSLFTHKSRGTRSIFYSLFGDVLPEGHTVLGTIRGNAEVTAVKLSDADGHLIPVTFGGATTGINEKVIVNRENSATAETYDLQGRRVAQPRRGIYVINGKKVVK